MTLPLALAPLAAHRQFISYITRPSIRPGKTDKLPTNWQTGQVDDAHNPAIWTDYTTAWLAGGGQVGFVLTDHDPFWFLDIDDCLTPAGWSSLALELLTMLRGCAVEVSISGKGLHLFGVGIIPPHRTKPSDTTLGLELYHTKRFVALGGRDGTVGDAMTDCTVGLAAVVAKYFAKDTPDAPPAEWTNYPRADWTGPTDDDDLIRRMCASKSAAGIFGSRATAQQLWDADPQALARCYPDPVGERPYDGSSADAALAQHLAFWTGNDCARMQRLMQGSKLARDKWDREDYLPRTILSATARQVEVCHDKPTKPPTDYTVIQTNEARSVEGDRFMDAAQQIIVFYKCVYVADVNMILMPGGHRFGQERFDNLLGGYSFVMDRNNTKTTKSAWEAFTKSQAVDFPKVLSSEFRPEREAGEIWIDGNQRIVNSYWPVRTPSQKGNAAPFLKHLAKMLPVENDRQIVLSYMAAVVQHPGVKFQWAPLIQGAEGNGKTLLSRCLIKAVGKEHSHSPKSSEITEKFNGWTCNKIFISVEDVYTPRDKLEVIEELKPLITNDWLEIRGMGLEKITRHICCNFMLNSNHKDAIRKTRNDRRFAVFYTSQQSRGDIEASGMGGSYFPDLYAWLKRDGYEIVTEYLRNYPIQEAFNPARGSHRAPITSSHSEVILASMGRMEQEISEAVESDRVGFRGGWISSHFLDQLIKEVGMDRQYSKFKRREMLQDLGYILHPGLPRGQTNNAVKPDGVKPRIWVLATHTAMKLDGVTVAREYEKAQALAD